MQRRNQIINRIATLAGSLYPDSELYLYGSRARGDSKSFSDWDLLFLLNIKNISFEVETKVMDEFYELELETGEIFSPLIYSKHDWENIHYSTPLFENIQKEGIRIK